MSSVHDNEVLLPLDWMTVRVVGTPECKTQAKYVGKKGVVVMVNQRLPHWAHVRLERQVKLRLFETKNLRIMGESPTRATMLANGYTAADGPVSPTAPALVIP